MNPTLLPHRIAETTEALALFACGYDPEWDEHLAAELDQSDGSVFLAAEIAFRLGIMLDENVTLVVDPFGVPAYLKIVN